MHNLTQIGKILLGTVLATVIFLPACSKESGQPSKEVSAAQAKHLKEIAELEKKRTATLEKVRQMPMPELVKQMDDDAEKGREPFNSPAYREVTRNKQSQGDALLQEIGKSKQVSYISLLALRKIDAAKYETLDQQFKLDALLREFARSTSYNKWGIPHLYWEDTAKALIELGEPALPRLQQFLSDCQPAPVWGSEESAVYQQYQYRRCDYALALIMSIRGEKVADLPESPEARDNLIKALAE